MMDEDQEFKFVCKLCFKRYPCGKSLGGHMRSHVAAESDEKLDPIMRKYPSFGGCELSDSRMGELGNGQSSYGLRENPRKSWRAVDSTFPSPQGKICKQCGKGFHSLKALCGHMACHSDKDRGLKDDHSWSTSENNQKVVMDSHSDTEGEDRVIRTRSCKSKKLKKIVVKSNLNLPTNNGSSSVSEIDGEEQEEVAICLMMLSRDCGSKGGVNSVVESSDNNSVILETKSSSIDMKRDTGINLHEQYETHKSKKLGEDVVKSKACAFDADEAEMQNSDSGYFLDECAKAESDVSVDGFRRNGGFDEFLSRTKKENEYEYDHGGGRIEKSRKRRYIADPYDDYDKTKRNDHHPIGETSQKRDKYECINCKKSFKSYQALGGHRPCHKKSNAFYESRYESGENSLDESTEFAARGKVIDNRKTSGKDKKLKAKKSKGHACPFCDRVFKNGQALGGHKRSHFIGGHEVINNHTTVSKLDLLDLNLPAPQDEDVEDDDDGNEPYSPW